MNERFGPDVTRRRSNAQQRLARFAGAFVALFWLQAAWAGFDPSLNWYTLRTAHFRIHFHDGERNLAKTAAAVAERVHDRLQPLFDWEPQAPTEVVLTDRLDVANGDALPFPYNRMTLYVNPPDDVSGLEDYAGWLETLITHEYTHVLHLDKAAGGPRLLRHVLGRNEWLFPARWQPLWFIEGLAVYMETDPDRGVGRGQSSYYDMLMRMEVDNGIKPVRQINQYVRAWPGGATPYLYGVNFHEFIASQRGRQRINALVDNYSTHLVPFSINTNAQEVLGAKLPALWTSFDAWLRDKYTPQLQRIRTAGVVAGRRLTHHGYQTKHPRTLPNGSVFYIRADGEREPALMRLSPGGVPQVLAEAQAGARFDVHPRAGIVMSRLEYYRNENLFSDLYHIDLASGATRRLTRGGRYRSPAWSPDGTRIAAVHSELGVPSVRLLDADGDLQETLWQGEYGEVVSEMDWSPDGQWLVAALWRPGSGWNLERFSLAERRWSPLTADAAIEAEPRFSHDGRMVLFSADYGGVYNIQRLDLASGRITTLTNVLGGAFYPCEGPQGALYYTGYDATGFDIYRLESTAADSEPQATPGPSGVAFDPPPAEVLSITPYSPFADLRPRWWGPHFVADGQRLEWGVVTTGSDSLRRHVYSVDLAYDVRNDMPAGTVSWFYDRWYPKLVLQAGRQNIPTLGTNGNLASIRRSVTWSAETLFPLWRYRRQWGLRLGVSRTAESDAFVAKGFSAMPDASDAVVGLAVAFDSSRSYVLSVSPSNGRQMVAGVEDSDILPSDYSGQVYTLDWREYLATGSETVLALRGAVGWGSADPRPFNLGGASGNVPGAASLAQRAFASSFNNRHYPLRGYPQGLAALTGRRMALASAEWRFPLHRIERGIMAPPLALQQLSAAVFADAGSAWDGDRPQHVYSGAGVELNFDLSVFYQLDLRMRLGVARSLDSASGGQIYLAFGSAF